MNKTRCPWGESHPLYIPYHDEEWGVPTHDDRTLFEHLLLDGFQAGLSWLTILKKRDNYRLTFDGFDAEIVAAYGQDKIDELLNNPGIIRNRQKINAAIRNAKAFLKIQEEFGSFEVYIWGFVGGKTIKNCWRTQAETPATSPESEAMSKDLKKRGFGFVGPTICYAFMQAAGLVNDHLISCFRYDEVS
ncbi:MAG: DNA-3-methyladenine glycosylase I [Anaerolineaceae bacterium]|nr:DNA-3-methyladenine glycosylase I [Anaerolineaceae bacterium]